MTLLSELIEKGSAHLDVEIEEFGDFKRCSAHGVKIDVDDVTVPEGIDEIGFIAEFDEGEFSEETIDIVISAIMSEVDTTIEIPAAADVQDPRHIVATASSMDCSLALLPPEDTSDEAFDAFIERVLEFARAYVSQGNMSRRILPISSYLEYLFIEVLKPDLATEYSPVDPQVVSQYHGVVTVERADAMKTKLRSVFHEAYGGEDEFRQFALSLMGAIYDRIEEDCVQSAEMNAASNAGGHADQKIESPQSAPVADASGSVDLAEAVEEVVDAVEEVSQTVSRAAEVTDRVVGTDAKADSSSSGTDSGVSSSSDGGGSSVSSGGSGGE